MDTVQNPESLRDRQIALEEESLTLGIDRYKKERERQDEADSGPGRRLIRDCITPLSAAIESYETACGLQASIDASGVIQTVRVMGDTGCLRVFEGT